MIRHIAILDWRDLDHPRAGGSEVECHELASYFASWGYRVTMLAAAVDGKPRVEDKHGYRIRRAGGQFTVYPRALLWLLLHRRSIDAVVDSQNGIPFFSPLAVGRRTPVIMLLHHVHQQQFGMYFSRPVAAVGRLLEGLGSRLVYRSRTISVVSPSTKRDARLVLRLRGQIKVIPPGWRLSANPPDAAALRSPRPSIVSVGRLVPHKRTRLIIEAVARLRTEIPDLHLNVVGGGAELEELRDYTRRNGLEHVVRFFPDCSDEVRDQVIASSWLMVNASAGEGWGLSVIEANALGIPVVAFDRPGLRDSIRDGQTGWLVPEDSDASSDAVRDAVHDLAAGIESALTEVDTPAAAFLWGEATRGWAANFTWEATAAKMLHTLWAEQRRLAAAARDGARAARSCDVASIVTVPASAVPAGWTPPTGTDAAVTREDERVVIMLDGVDTSEVADELNQLALDDAALLDVATVRVADSQDYMLYFGGRDVERIIARP